jgi:hypothetical protein
MRQAARMRTEEANSRRRLSWSQVVFIAAFVVPIGAFGLAAGCLAYFEHRDASETARFFSTRPLIADLPENNSQAEGVMRERLLAQNEIGGQTFSLRNYLLSQGFSIREIDHSRKSYIAGLTRPGNLAYIGRRDWRVTWEEDADGRLTRLDVSQHVTMSSAIFFGTMASFPMNQPEQMADAPASRPGLAQPPRQALRPLLSWMPGPTPA